MRKLCFPKIGFGFVFALMACSSDEGESERTRADFCNEWAEAACSQPTVAACQAASAEDCRVSQASFCLNLVPDSFDDSRADECLRAVSRAYADADLSASELVTVLRLGEPCDRLVRGPRGAGETCETPADCDGPGGFTCVTKGNTAAGTCEIAEAVNAGLECTAAQHVCTDGFYCNGQNCIATLRAGAACQNQDQCGSENFCSVEGLCAERLAVNSPCTSDLQCLSGLCFTFGIDDQVCADNIRLSRSEPHCETLR